MLKKLTFSVLFALLLSNTTFAQSKFWKKLEPDQVNLQYAGSIGFLSVGAGYDLFNEKAGLSLHVGYVPEDLGGELTIIAVKFHYRPFKIPIGDKFIIEPFNPVFFPSYTLGQNFDFKFEKPKYREGYYFWSSALRVHLGASTEVKVLSRPDAKIKALSLYAEANTNDLYALSWFQNRTSTPFYRIFRLGYGVKMHF
ncbi:hypothetical protein FA048_15530 [Pedobacter polaris]|uniref:Outer membrane protein beta-barrel domain-containing protein n=1 Tax=Pedobacter polaris TaxID=2571273 RepID=A0A4V6WN43_9SPHI|nr:hypothetical protein [Pedobacter polaris]TKC06616.1 hypothetical protein FA048_15530 [Pedobacter polaris]